MRGMGAVKVDVVIPFSPDSPERSRALDWVRAAWTAADYTPITSTSHGEWRKAVNIEVAMRARRDSDIVVIADADCWVDPIQLGVDRLNQWRDWGMPHRRVVRLSSEHTRRMTSADGWRYRPGEMPRLEDATFEEEPYTAFRAAGGIVVLKREVWNRVPMDPRFVGWGFEDEAWWYALRTLAGVPWRGKADLFHLYHPRSDASEDRIERSLEANPENQELRQRYKAALHKPPAMQQLVDEAKDALSSWR